MLKKIAYVTVLLSAMFMSGCCTSCALLGLGPIAAALAALAASGAGTAGN